MLFDEFGGGSCFFESSIEIGQGLKEPPSFELSLYFCAILGHPLGIFCVKFSIGRVGEVWDFFPEKDFGVEVREACAVI